MKQPEITRLTETYARMALRILTGPRDAEWHQEAGRLLDQGPDYGWPRDANGEATEPRDVIQMAGLILGYCAGLVEWTPEEP